MSAAFSVYIAFMLLCLMNIITGTFVQSALQGAENDRAREFVESARSMFVEVEEDELAMVTQEQYNDMLEDPEFQYHLRLIGVNDPDAQLLFRLLDQDQAGEVEFEKLIANIIRLHSGAKFMDIMKLMYVVECEQKEIEGLSKQVDKINEDGTVQSTPHVSHVKIESSLCSRCGHRANQVFCLNCGHAQHSHQTDGQKIYESRNLGIPGGTFNLPPWIPMNSVLGDCVSVVNVKEGNDDLQIDEV